MRLFSFPLRNVYSSWWRSLTLGAFIFFISFIFVFSNSFVNSVKNKMQGNVSNAVSGDIQIRPASSKEQDMVMIGSSNWDEVFSIPESLSTKIQTVLEESDLEYIEHIRLNMVLITDTSQEPVMAIGLDPGTGFYKDAYVLKKGRLLGEKSQWEIILAQDVAESLKVGIGDRVAVLCSTKDGYTIDAEFKVVGIGDIQMLGLFGINVCYIDLESARYLAGFEQGEVTDIIAYSHEGNNLELEAKKLKARLAAKSISTIENDIEADLPNSVRITTLDSMGGYVMGIISIITTTLYSFIIILMFVVSILIWNLVFMMGIERYKEIGTMRALGFSRFKIVWLFIAEILFITALAGFLGIVSGSALVLVLAQTGIPAPERSFVYYMGSVLYLKFDVLQIIPLIVILFLFSFWASFIPALKISSLKPVETIREQ
jgi:putative ABC transport system permease protein